MRKIVRRAILLSAALAGLASSAQEKPALSPLPAGSFQLQGSWNCEGTFRNGKPHQSTYSGAVVLGGKWLELSEQDTVPATGYVAKYLIGYDAQAKRLVEFDANNFGAATYSSDEGWENGVLTMVSAVSDDAKAPYAANRFVYRVETDGGFIVDWQVSKTAALQWVTADHLACKRMARS